MVKSNLSYTRTKLEFGNANFNNQDIVLNCAIFELYGE